jgi:hypothetical protein
LPRLADEVFWEPGGPSVIELLEVEHRRMGALCAWLRGTRSQARRREIADVVTATVARHLSAEEQYVYPSVRAALPDGDALADREIAEDRALLRTLRDLADADPAGPHFDQLVAALADALTRHSRVSGQALLPRLRAEVSDADLVRLGNRVEVAQEAAPTRPHPRAPATPPWNKLVDPALGVMDKARDALTGRPTYPDDL